MSFDNAGGNKESEGKRERSKMRKVYYILVILLLVPACGERQRDNVQIQGTRSKTRLQLEEAERDLLEAAREGDLHKAKELLAEGIGVNVSDNEGNTPLHLAAGSGHVSVVRLLIAQGADVNARNDQNWTPLHKAAREQHKEIFDMLAASGATRFTAPKGEPPYTVSGGRCEICGEVIFVAQPGLTTEEDIRRFANLSNLPDKESIAKEGWLHPGEYCPNGCHEVYVTWKEEK